MKDSTRGRFCLVLAPLLLTLVGAAWGQARLVAVDEGAGQVVFFNGNDFQFIGATAVGTEPRQPAIVTSLQHLYVPNRDSNSVTVLDYMNGTVVTTINHAGFNQPISAAVNRNDSEVWVLNRQGGSGDGSISIISTASNSVIETVNLASFSDPVFLVFQAALQLFHVVNAGNETMTSVNAVTRAQRAIVNVGSDPVSAVVNDANGLIFVANNGGSLTRVNTANFTTSTIPIVGSPRSLAVLGDQLFVTQEDQSLSRVNLISVATQQITPFGAGFSTYGLSTLAGTNLLLVGDQTNDRIHAVNSLLETEYVSSPFPLNGFTRLGAIVSVGENTRADLSIVKADLEDPVRAGQILAYALQVTNAGPATATGLVIQDLLPEDTIFDSANIPGGQCQLSGAVVECRLDSLQFGAEVTATVRVIPQGQGTITNQSAVSGDQDDPNEGDNSSNEATQVLPSADLEVLLMATPQTAPVGGTIQFDILVRNNGPSTANQTTLTFRPPRNAVVVGSQTQPANCNVGNAVAICNLASLARSGEFPLSFQISPLEAGRFQASAQVNSLTHDANASNNSRILFVDITSADFVTDLTISKSTFTPEVAIGEEARFGIIVRNFGPDTNQLVRWVDPIPAGFSFVSVFPSTGCSSDGNQVTCELGALPVGENLDFVLTLRAEVDAYGLVTNQAGVEGLGQDPDITNNQASDTVLIAGSGDFNQDGRVDAADLQELILELSDGDGEKVEDVAGGSHAGTILMDLNHDGLINQADLELMNRLLFA